MCGVCRMCREGRVCLPKSFLNNRFFWNAENICKVGYYRTNGWSRLVGVFCADEVYSLMIFFCNGKIIVINLKCCKSLWLMTVLSCLEVYTDPLPRHNHISCARTLGLCVACSPKPIFDLWPPIRARREQMQKLGCRVETINIEMVPSSREVGLWTQRRGLTAQI